MISLTAFCLPASTSWVADWGCAIDRPLGHVELAPTAPAIKRCLSDGKSHHFAATPQACCLRSLYRARPPTSVVQGFQTLRGDFVRDLIRLCGGVASHFAVPRPPTSAASWRR